MTDPSDPHVTRDVESLLEDTDSQALLGRGADPRAPRLFDLLRLGRRLSQSRSESEVLQTLDSALADTIPHRRRAILLLQGGNLTVRHITGSPAEPADQAPLPRLQLLACLDEGSAREVLLDGASALLAPIVGVEGVHGVIYLEVVGESDAGSGRAVTRLEMLDAVAYDAGLAIERCRLTAALAASEERHRALVEHSILGIYCTTPAGEILLANPAMLRMLGFDTLEQLIASGNLEQETYQPSYARSLFKAMIERDGSVIGLESAWRRRDGSTAFLRENAGAIRDPEGKILYYLGTVEDVTEQRRAESLLQSLVDTLPLAIIGVDPRGAVRLWNPAAEKIFGWSAHEVLGEPSPLVPDERRDEHRALVARREAGEVLTGHETRRLRRDGTAIDVAIWSAGLSSDGGEEFHIGVLADISARKQAEADYRALFEAARDAILIFSPANEIVLDVNSSACELYDIPRERFIGRSLLDLSRDPDAKRMRVEETLNASGGAVRFETVQYREDGTPLELEVNAALVSFQGQPAILTINRDVSERKRLEEQYRQAHKLEALGQLAGGVAHDFNNVLTAILGYSELARHKAEPDTVQPYLTEISGAARRASNLARQLLTFARTQPVNPRPTDLASVVAEMQQMLGLVGSAGVTLSVDSQPGLVTHADPGQIQRVVLNLVRNAADAMPDGGQLQIRVLAQGDDRVALEVRDDGCGMDERTRARVFEPFFTTKPPEQGTGLGLSTVYGIVQQHGGHIEVESTLGVGTCVRVSLPRSSEAAIAEPSVPEPALHAGNETILLVEDDPIVRRMSRATLEEAGYHVIEAVDGQDALLQIDRDSPAIDLAITDVLMPQIDGPAFAAQLATRLPDVPVLFVSAFHADDSERLRGKTLLTKPYTPQTLTRAVRELLDG